MTNASASPQLRTTRPTAHGRRRSLTFAIVALTAAILFSNGQSPTSAQDQGTNDDPLPNLLLLGKEEADAGNPLAGFLQLLELEERARAANQTHTFFDVKATRLSMMGDTQGAKRSWAEINRRPAAKGPLLSSPLDDYQPTSAIDFIVKKAETHRVIMIGEEHVEPQTRSLLKPLLQRLKEQGFRYFAAETFNEDLKTTASKGYTLTETGFYTREPVFAVAVNEAIALGYELVPYERKIPYKPAEGDGPLANQNHRERTQAENLKSRIFDKDPDAKVLVWAGRSHVTEEAGEVPGVGTLKPMAFQFKEMTGIDPFSVYLPAGTEQATPDFEFKFYRYATHHGWVQEPSIFTNESGETYGFGGDALVFFPRVQLVAGRPDWLVNQLGRQPVEIPRELLTDTGYQLVQAFHVDDVEHAVPIDQVLIKPGDPVPKLMLPPATMYYVRCIDAEGEVHGPLEVDTGDRR